CSATTFPYTTLFRSELAEGEPIRKAKKNVKPKSPRVAKALAQDAEQSGSKPVKRKTAETQVAPVKEDKPVSSIDRKSKAAAKARSEEHTSELQSREN